MFELLQKYDQQVPRYTSYPTAPYFSDSQSASNYLEILESLPQSQSISLYIHIPFCPHLCTYCGCNTKVVDHMQPVLDYLNILKQEVKLITASIGKNRYVSNIHFGGGTPNFMPKESFADLIEFLSQNFSIDADSMIAVEADPRLLTTQYIDVMVKSGVKRISLGVQDFNIEVQKAINRIQSFELISSTIENLRDAGISSINFDMIYGLPLQTLEIVQNNIELLCKLKPERVALFAYAHVPWFKTHQKVLENYNMPAVLERYYMAETSRKQLIDLGYMPIGIDHFAFPNDDLAQAATNKKLHRNFQGYTTDNEQILIGLGQSSISDYYNAYVQNSFANKEYREMVLANKLPAVKMLKLTDEDIYRRAVIEQIMCYGEVDISKFLGAETFATKVWSEAQAKLKTYADDGLVLFGDNKVKVTEQGRIFTRLIASAFDEYMNKQSGDPVQKHAKAV